MIYNNLFFGLSLFFLIGASLSIVFNKKDRLAAYCSFLSASIASVFGIIFSISVIFGENFSLSFSGSSFLNFGFFVDKLSAFFTLVISIAVFAVSIYSIGYTREYYGKKNIGYLGFFYNIFILSMILVVSANNAIMFIILSFLILSGGSGSFNFDSMNAVSMPPLLKDLTFLFALIGFGAKAGIVPLHIWLPYAHPAAPSNVSALMSGVMIKTAISLSMPALISAILLFISIPVVIGFIDKSRSNRVYETWGCGQPASTARNEYTACAFSKPVQMWFRNVLRPAREGEK